MPQGTTPFTIGQTVFVVDRELFDVTCTACEGEKVIHGKDGQPFACPGCFGSGNSHEWSSWRVSSPQVVTKMETEEDGVTVEYSPNGWIGVPADQVFDTFDEALADAKRRNAEIGEGE